MWNTPSATSQSVDAPECRMMGELGRFDHEDNGSALGTPCHQPRACLQGQKNRVEIHGAAQ